MSARMAAVVCGWTTATCDPASMDTLRDGLRRATGTALTVVGEIQALEAGVTFLDAAGNPVMVTSGYEHFRE